jgi:WD40 repeat protein
MEPYNLVNVLHAHDGPVRCIAFGSNGRFVTGCQSDSPCVRSWSIKVNSVEELGVPLYHDHWVTAITILSPNQQRAFNPEGCVITGCMDSKIRVFDNNGALLNTLEGHSKGIISFSWTTVGFLVSGSWDGSALIWDLSSSSIVQRLQPHENGVHVLGLSNSTVATTSTGESVDGKPANFKLRLWDVSSGAVVGAPIADHAGSLRSIAAVPGINGFMTTANDGTVALRSIDGEAMGTMYHAPQEDGSAPFILDW